MRGSHSATLSSQERAGEVLDTVVSVDPIYVRLDADENSLLKYVKLDEEGKRKSARNAQMPAWTQLGNETDFPHEGVIDFVDNRLDPNTGTVRGRVVLRNWIRSSCPVSSRVFAWPARRRTRACWSRTKSSAHSKD